MLEDGADEDDWASSCCSAVDASGVGVGSDEEVVFAVDPEAVGSRGLTHVVSCVSALKK